MVTHISVCRKNLSGNPFSPFDEGDEKWNFPLNFVITPNKEIFHVFSIFSMVYA